MSNTPLPSVSDRAVPAVNVTLFSPVIQGSAAEGERPDSGHQPHGPGPVSLPPAGSCPAAAQHGAPAPCGGQGAGACEQRMPWKPPGPGTLGCA